MKAVFILIALLALILGGYWFWRSRSVKMTGDEFVEMVKSHMPHLELSGLGEYHLSNGTWWQDTPTFQTPEKKPIKIHFISPDIDQRARPSEAQIALSKRIQSNLSSLWPDIMQTYHAFIDEWKDPVAIDQSYDWEINIYDAEKRWTISFKAPKGELSFYELTYLDMTRESGVATY